MPVWLYAHRSQKLKSLHQQLAAYVAETDKERQKLEQDKADLKKKEDSMRARLQVEFDKKENELQEMFDKKQEELQRKFDILEAERRDWEEEKERVKQTTMFAKVVTLDVGGTKYRTTLSTLTKYPDSMLGVMFSGRHDFLQQEDGSYFIDRHGEPFQYILMYLRDRDICFDVLYDESLNISQHSHQSYLPSPLEKPLLKQIAYEAEYFQVRELETKIRIMLNVSRFHNSAFDFRALFNGYSPRDHKLEYEHYPAPLCCKLDYGQGKLDCRIFSKEIKVFKHAIITHVLANTRGVLQYGGLNIMKKVTFESCDLSGATFKDLYFQDGVSFEGCILHGTKFERVGGLVHHKVHFAPWQVAQADFEPELLQALKDNGCIY